MKISLITINYHSQKYLKGLLFSVGQQLLGAKNNDYELDIIIVNNEKDPLVLDFNIPFPLKIINSGQNLGFGKANNLAAKKSQGDYLLFINPDVELKNASLLTMFDHISQHPEIGALGPQIILASQKRPQPWTCGKKTTLKSILFRNSINKPWNKKTPTEVDWVSGTALLIKKEDFWQINGFDENFFMYFEDQDLCLRLKQLGKKNFFYPQASLLHYDGKSWSNKKKQKGHFYHSQDYFFQKHASRFSLFLLRSLRLPMKVFYQAH